ncbi:hypothetical protein LOK49_LG03G03479 [Camellia lanceoleosa]|uniref:Uncharacterized protein n=1 Tax=Camellia lanceoleosa TaxID=1840588 RepID=A0ACC0I4X2_9ERIC|nr:hypothetical protein LOK49_LG03G03479 [Camellia lanceoleosa]
MAVNPSDGHDFVTLELKEGTDEWAWKTKAKVSITSWLDNVYLFKFGDEEDKALILRTAPWSVIGNLLILQPLLIGKSISEMNFTYSPFWVQVNGLPMEKMTCRNGKIIAETIGKLVGVEVPVDGLLLARSFLRTRVDINTSLLLPRGFELKRQKPDSTGKTDLWVEFKYEHLSDFCYDCGRIGHDNKSCKFVTREEGILSGYGPELRTGMARNLGLVVEYYCDQIDDLEDNLQPILLWKKILAPTSEGGMHGRSEHCQRKAPDETYILPTLTKIPKLDYKTSITPLSLEPVPVADKGGISRKQEKSGRPSKFKAKLNDEASQQSKLVDVVVPTYISGFLDEQCSWTRPVWFGCDLGFLTGHDSISSAVRWTQSVLESCTNDQDCKKRLGKTATIGWCLWKARNAWVFNRSKVDPVQLISQASSS